MNARLSSNVDSSLMDKEPAPSWNGQYASPLRLIIWQDVSLWSTHQPLGATPTVDRVGASSKQQKATPGILVIGRSVPYY
jgi:hypothetical protein